MKNIALALWLSGNMFIGKIGIQLLVSKGDET